MWRLLLVVCLATNAHCGAAKPGRPGRPTKWINSFAGPWVVNVDKVYMCSEEEMEKSIAYVDFHLRVSHWNPLKPNELQVYNGNMTLHNCSVDNEKWLDKRSNNMWKQNAFHFRCPSQCCEFVRTYLPDMWRAGFGQDPKAGGPCYAKQGVYHVINQTIKWNSPAVPVMPYGHYRATLKGGKHGLERSRKPGMCLHAEIYVVARVD